MADLLTNSDLAPDAPPGVYLQFRPGAGATGNIDNRLAGRFKVRIIAGMDSSGTADPNKSVPILSVSDAIAKFGARSGVRRLVERVLAQRPAGLKIEGVGIVMSGAAAVFTIKVIGTAVGTGYINLRINDYLVPVFVNNGDTASVIAAAMNAAIAKVTNLPFTAAVSTDTLTLTATIPGAHLNNHPVVVNIDDTISGISLSPGTITVAATAGASGSVTVNCGTKSTPAAITSGDDDPTSAGKISAALNAASDQNIKSTVSGSVVTLLFRNNKTVDRITLSVASVTTQTYTLAGQTAGSGAPNLTLALNGLTTCDACQEWVTEFNDATSLGSLVTHIRSEGDGERMKEQFLTYGYSGTVVAGGALAASISPTIITEDASKASPGRFLWTWSPDYRQPASEIAAMRAAERAFQRRPTGNFNYRVLSSVTPAVPLTFPDENVRPDPTTTGQCRKTYYGTPIVIRNGNMCVESDVTTYGGSLPYWNKSSFAHGAAYYRQFLLARLSAAFPAVEVVQHSTKRSDNVINTDDVIQVIDATNTILENDPSGPLFDGAAGVKDQIKCKNDPNNPGDLLIFAPFRLPIENDHISGTMAPV